MRKFLLVVAAVMTAGSAHAGTGMCYDRINGHVHGYDCDPDHMHWPGHEKFCVSEGKAKFKTGELTRSELKSWILGCQPMSGE